MQAHKILLSRFKCCYYDVVYFIHVLLLIQMSISMLVCVYMLDKK